MLTLLMLPPAGSTCGAEERPRQRQPQGDLEDASALQPDRCAVQLLILPHVVSLSDSSTGVRDPRSIQCRANSWAACSCAAFTCRGTKFSTRPFLLFWL